MMFPALFAATCAAAEFSPADLVTPIMGTDSDPSLSAGNVYPSISRPWGMHSWTPQTAPMSSNWFYSYRQLKMRGFRQTRQPSPWMGDYGAFAVFPMTGKPVFDEAQRASWFSHKAETARPYRYSVYLADYDTTFEIAPTARAAHMRITYPETDSPLFLVDLIAGGKERGSLSVDKAARRITGRIDCRGGRGAVAGDFVNHFVIEFDRDFELAGDVPATSGAIVRFPPARRGTRVGVKVASSFIDAAQAERNLHELDAGDFDAVAAQGRAEWNALLSRARVEGGPDDRIRTFYTCLYRSLLFPRIHWEVGADGKPVHRSPVNGKVENGYYYAGTGFWDTFRALFPLLNFLYPEVNARMSAGLANCWRECGWLPEWSNPGLAHCMIGNNSASVVADAILSGVVGEKDAADLYQALLHGANAVHPENHHVGRAGFKEYNEKGYVPRDIGISESAARTLEYAYDDWCIARLGRHLGRPDEEVAVYEARARNWRNVFNPAVGLACGRSADGRFAPDFNMFRWGGDFTEGTPLHYTWSVFHDIAGLIDAMGGRAAFVKRLDEVFSLPPTFDKGSYRSVIHEIREMQIVGFGQYAHGNQPIQHMIYLYDWAGEPWKTQYWVREALDRLYSPTPDGYCGDEDNGQTSAWYVWSALGFYPVCPGSGEYALGAPLFPKATLSLPGGRKLEIAAPGADENRYVARLALNGKEPARTFLTRKELLAGGRLQVEMISKPVTSRNTLVAPYSQPAQSRSIEPRVVEDATRLSERQAEEVIGDICAGRPTILVGGPFLSNRLLDWGDVQMPCSEVRRRLETIGIAHELVGPSAGFHEGKWAHGIGPRTIPGGKAERVGDALRLTTGGELMDWDHFSFIPGRRLFAPGENILVMEVRSECGDAQLSVELSDSAGGRWVASISFGGEWKRFALDTAAFRCHEPARSGLRSFLPETISRICIGFSQQYTPGMTKRKGTVLVRRVGTSPSPLRNASMASLPYTRFPVVEGVWPPYKTHVKNGIALMFDRPVGEGYGRNSPWRLKRGATPAEWILLERRQGVPERCVACFGYTRAEDMARPDVQRRVAETRELFAHGTILYEGGSRHFAYHPGETVLLGASWRGPARDLDISVENSAKEKVFSRRVAAAAMTNSYETAWTPPAPGTYSVRVEMAGDSISHEFTVAAPRADPAEDFIVARDGDFWLKGRKWYAVGVNFWPRYSLGTEHRDYWETWLRDGYYTPSLVQRDLEIFVSLGGNMVSIQAPPPGHERNLVDFFRRCRALGIHANLWSAVFNPLAFNEAGSAALISAAEIAGDSTVFAFDTIWEPGNSLFSSDAHRAKFDADWQAWIVSRYGSIARAEKDWGTACRRNAKGEAMSPPDEWFSTDGAWRRQMAAYRRFMDNVTSRRWNGSTRRLRALSPHTLVSFRQGNTRPYDFALTGPVRHLDFVCPEGYSYTDSDKSEAAIGWNTRFIDAWSGGKPIIWSEFGSSVWNREEGIIDTRYFKVAARYCERFYRAALAAGANGTSPWWWPGGYRTGERSDCGIVDPDGTPRPTAELIRQYAPKMLRPRPKPVPEVWHDYDRDSNAGGYWAATFGEGAKALADAYGKGKMLGVRLAGSGTTSADCPALAIGDVPCDGTNPPKFLDAEIDRSEIASIGDGKLRVKAVFGNIGMAAWLPGASGKGGVALVARAADGRELARAPVGRRVDRFAATDEMTLDLPPGTAICRLEAIGRFAFGEPLPLTDAPKSFCDAPDGTGHRDMARSESSARELGRPAAAKAGAGVGGNRSSDEAGNDRGAKGSRIESASNRSAGADSLRRKRMTEEEMAW